MYLEKLLDMVGISKDLNFKFKLKKSDEVITVRKRRNFFTAH